MDTLHFFIPQHLWPNSRQIDDSVICRRWRRTAAAHSITKSGCFESLVAKLA